MKVLFWGLSVFCLVGAARGGQERGYHFEPLSFQEQGFVGGGPSNQFPRAQGTYHGLLQPTNGLAPDQSGDLRIDVSSFGSYSGRMNIGGSTTPLRGHFNDQGRSGIRVYKRVWDDCDCFYTLRLIWVVNLQLIWGTDQIQGTVEHARLGWVTELLGYRGYTRTTGPAAQAGRYTLRLPGSSDPAIAPGGDGYAAVRVDSRGRLSASGQLADGTAFSRSAVISTNGWWPFYLSLSNGDGALIGWLQLAELTGTELAGNLDWVRPRREDRPFYPDGFSGTVSASGSRYAAPGSGETSLGWTDGVIVLSGGNLAAPVMNSITLLPGGGLADQGVAVPNLKFSLKKSTGLFKGKFVHPGSGLRTAYSGALLQLQGIGAGYFLGTNQSGLVRLQAAP